VLVRNRSIVAVVLILIGLVWMGQGTGVIQGSGFMTNDMTWAAIGLVVFAIGAVVGGLAVMRRPRA
jgi:hypothetical protein